MVVVCAQIPRILRSLLCSMDGVAVRSDDVPLFDYHSNIFEIALLVEPDKMRELPDEVSL